MLNPASSRPKRRRSYHKSGIYTLKRAVQALGSRALPTKRTALGRALHEWRSSLVADLGGEEAVSTQQLALVELAVRTKLLVGSVDAYVLGMPSPVNRQKQCLHPVVRERQALVNQLQSLLRDLGVERKANPVPTLDEYLRDRERAASPRAGADGSAAQVAGGKGRRRDVTSDAPGAG